MQQATAMLGLLAETPLHAGAGKMVGVIDLPIQREAPTGWPCVYGSAVKGALRTAAGDADWVAEVFGPETKNSSEHAGALAVGDARLVLLPVRSLTSHFKWVTCPSALQRLVADARRLGLGLTLPDLQVGQDEALVAEKHDESLFLEDQRFTPKVHDLAAVIAGLAQLMPRGDAKTVLRRQLVVVGDDDFTLLSRFATPVAAHVRIDPNTKTVEDGALWYEETLPPSTLLSVALVAFPSRKKDSERDAARILGHVSTDLFGGDPAYLQLGGNETVGMGWCRVQVVGGKEAAK